jgi:hypothetical protein
MPKKKKIKEIRSKIFVGNPFMNMLKSCLKKVIFLNLNQARLTDIGCFMGEQAKLEKE